jgi:hypothetical protein
MNHHTHHRAGPVAAALLFTAILAAPLAVFAQSGTGDSGAPPDGPSRDHPHGPPPEAIAACKGKAVGVVASFTDRGGRTVSGPCTQMGDVVAVPPPQHKAGDKDGGPPTH